MADERVPELVTDLEDQMAACLLSELPIERKKALAMSKKVARHITDNWGGQLIYIPKNHLGQLSERDMQVYRDFDGCNHAALAKKYRLTVQQIYKIVKEVGRRERAKSQGDLFGGAADKPK
jgi:putative bacteriophage transcriptional regulator